MSVTTDGGIDERVLADTVARVCREAVRDGDARHGPTLWATLDALGLARIGVPEDVGGSGGTLRQAMVVLRSTARSPVSLPMAESSLVAGQLMLASGRTLPPGLTTVALAPRSLFVSANGALRMLHGTVPGVPWARQADRLVLGIPGADEDPGAMVVMVERAGWSVGDEAGEDDGTETRESIEVESTVATDDDVLHGVAPGSLSAWGALARSAQMCGAMQSVVELSLEYTAGRRQFGRPLSAFQAIQQSLAEMAGEVVLANGALDLAIAAIDAPGAGLQVAAALAKGRVGESAGTVARLAHQVHGAIGFTREYPLHQFTRRLWIWRDEFGDERQWYRLLGHRAGADDLWTLLTSAP